MSADWRPALSPAPIRVSLRDSSAHRLCYACWNVSSAPPTVLSCSSGDSGAASLRSSDAYGPPSCAASRTRASSGLMTPALISSMSVSASTLRLLASCSSDSAYSCT